MTQRRTALKELQKLDMKIRDERQRIQDFDPLFAEVEEPALLLEGELNTSRNRLKEMKLEERRLELATTEKRDRLRRLEERLGNVRNLREEAAVSAELEMVKRSLQNDEQEAFTLIDQVRKGEERVGELQVAFEEAAALVEPKKDELLRQRDQAKEDLDRLLKERDGFTQGMDPEELRIYDAIRGGGRRAAVAELTEDGACGHCYGMIPLQSQNEVRHGTSLIRCESCGVILAAPDPAAAPTESAPEAGATGAASDEGSADDAPETAGVTASADGDTEGDDEE